MNLSKQSVKNISSFNHQKSAEQDIQAKAERIFTMFEERDPSPQTALHYTSPFTLAVSVILSAQSTDKRINQVMDDVKDQVDTPEKVVALGVSGLVPLFHSVTYYNSKSKHIFEMAKILLSRYEGRIPLRFEELVQLPGIGRKTANVILNTLTNHPGIAVDTHVQRLALRLGLTSLKTPEKIENDLYKVVPKRFWSRLNGWLTSYGRAFCKARHPNCSHCFLKNECLFFFNRGKRI